jgi:hypothetical protein
MILPDGVRELFARHERMFVAGSAADLAADYRNPVAVFLPDGLRVERTPADTIAVLERLQTVARDNGVVAVRHAVADLRAMRPDRPAVTVAWTFLGARRIAVARSRVRYFLSRQVDGRFLIEMLEYEAIGFTEDHRAWPPAGTVRH